MCDVYFPSSSILFSSVLSNDSQIPRIFISIRRHKPLKLLTPKPVSDCSTCSRIIHPKKYIQKKCEELKPWNCPLAHFTKRRQKEIMDQKECHQSKHVMTGTVRASRQLSPTIRQSHSPLVTGVTSSQVFGVAGPL